MELFSSLSIIHPQRTQQQELALRPAAARVPPPNDRRWQAKWTVSCNRDKRFQAERVDRWKAGLTIRTCPRWCIGDASAHARGHTVHRQRDQWWSYMRLHSRSM